MAGVRLLMWGCVMAVLVFAAFVLIRLGARLFVDHLLNDIQTKGK